MQRRNETDPGRHYSGEKHQDWIVMVQDGVVLSAFPSKLQVEPDDQDHPLHQVRMYQVAGALPNPPPAGKSVDPQALSWVEVRRLSDC